MFIALSGMVGSGKSTMARHITEVLHREGVDASVVRFRALGPFATLTPNRGDGPKPAPSPARRFTNFRVRTLTARPAFGYMFRMLWFRALGPAREPGTSVFDRYFYDSFVQYRLVSKRERLYLSMLRALTPKPDLSIVLLSSPDVIASRRPEYDTNYIAMANAGYARLAKEFTELIPINTDPGEPAHESVAKLLQQLVNGSRGRAEAGARATNSSKGKP
jgi:thymidylate kinase